MRIVALEQVDTHLWRGRGANGNALFLAFTQEDATSIERAVNTHDELVALVEALLPELKRRADAGPCMHNVLADWGTWGRLYMAARAVLDKEKGGGVKKKDMLELLDKTRRDIQDAECITNQGMQSRVILDALDTLHRVVAALVEQKGE